MRRSVSSAELDDKNLRPVYSSETAVKIMRYQFLSSRHPVSSLETDAKIVKCSFLTLRRPLSSVERDAKKSEVAVSVVKAASLVFGN